MATAEKTRVTPALLWLAVLAALVLVVLAVRSLTREQVAVRVVPVTRQTLVSSVPTNGKVEPVQEFQAHAPNAGVIQKVYVQVGDHVTPGTLLVRMEDAEAKARLASSNASISSARLSLSEIDAGGPPEDRNRSAADLAAARLEQQQAASNLALTQTLLAKGAASQSELAAAQQRVRSAQLSLDNASQRSGARYTPDDRRNALARLADARAGLAAAQSSYSAAVIRAPIAGTVYSVPVSEYDFVPAGDDLVDLADLNRIQVLAYFDEPEIGKLARGQAVKIVWDAKPGTTWHGHIERPPTTVITYGTRNVGECVITVDDARGDLLPNTNVTVTVTEMQRFNVLSIPREALHTDGSNNFVFRIVNHKLIQTPVQVGVVNLVNVEITSGISEKDLVVLGPVSSGKELINGLDVKQVE